MKKTNQKLPSCLAMSAIPRPQADAPPVTLRGKNLAAPRVSLGKIQKMLNVLCKHLEHIVIDPWSPWSIKFGDTTDTTSNNDVTW